MFVSLVTVTSTVGSTLGEFPPWTVAGAEPDLSSPHRQGSTDNPSFLSDQSKTIKAFLEIALLAFLSKTKSFSCCLIGMEGRAFPCRSPIKMNQVVQGIGLTEDSSCKQAGTCPLFRFHQSSHKTLPHSQYDVCLPKPPKTKTRSEGEVIG